MWPKVPCSLNYIVSQSSKKAYLPIIQENMNNTHNHEMLFLNHNKILMDRTIFIKSSHHTINTVKTNIATYTGDLEAISLFTGDRWEFPRFKSTPTALHITLFSLCQHTVTLCHWRAQFRWHWPWNYGWVWSLECHTATKYGIISLTGIRRWNYGTGSVILNFYFLR